MEIEKEVKKMTLGHEFGAGAACLKCKDKCEGFELHFWRKICRNCKCGLTEHDVSMNSEENKKVGKLFEDTKYTGLIAKLKTDGIPSYKGNMVTITLPSSATAYAVPPSSSSSVVPPSAPAVPVRPAGASAAAASIRGQAQVQPKPAPASVAPVKANKLPFTVSATSANVMPVPKDVPMKSVTYEWAPPVANKYMAVRYIELLPPEKRPVFGTEGAVYRRQQMALQLPEHDQDPSKCHELTPAEVKQMQQFVRKYKDEALGVGDVILPEEMALVQAGGQGGAGSVGTGGVGAGGPHGAGAGGVGAGGAQRADCSHWCWCEVSRVCRRWGQCTCWGSLVPGVLVLVLVVEGLVLDRKLRLLELAQGKGLQAGVSGLVVLDLELVVLDLELVVLELELVGLGLDHLLEEPWALLPPLEPWASLEHSRLGYHRRTFHAINASSRWVLKGKLYCGRHYGDSEKPRCGGCDELIFSNEYTQAEEQNWHLKHFCCFDCDCILAGETYVMENEKPVCRPCYMKNYAVKCSACQAAMEPEAQRVSYGEHQWHAAPECFKCSGCSKCLVGQRFMAQQGFLFCSVECKKKTMA
ncbi:unnamed protein product [Pleuronectes platessa]|uniref:Testin n=1 Tax=Pleuronectes platessa TaxID=8262 RepID=A0A9N7UL82_PLEPL|nr:unnamed protein product [Pleuronectes platessa]